MLPDMPIDMRSEGSTQQYVPKNYSRTYNNRLISIEDALEFSLNAPAVAAYHLVGGENYADTYVKLNGWEPIKDRMYPSAPLGAANMPLLEQTHAYNTLASMGVYYPKVSILQIKDNNGEVIKDFTKEISGKQVIEKKYIYMITELNKKYYLFGQNETLKNIQNNVADIAGKTGTSDNSAEAPGDVSFVAYTPTFTLGLWAGNSCGADKCPLTGQKASGEHLYFNMYEPILKKLLSQNKIPKARFERPEGVVSVSVCPKTGNASSEYCSGVQTIAADSNLPSEEDMYKTAYVTECDGEYKLARETDIELGFAKEKDYFFYKFPHKGIQDQVNKRIGGEVPPEEECTIERKVEKPEVIILTPSNNSKYTKKDTLNVRVSANGTFKIKKVEFALNNVIQSTSTAAPYSANIPLSNFSTGRYSLTVTATDEKGYTGSSTIEIVISNSVEDTPEPSLNPEVVFISPTSSQSLNKGANVMLRASFLDMSNSDVQYSIFDIYDGNAKVESCNTINVGTSSITCSWVVPTTLVSGKTYTIVAEINHTDGSTYSDRVNITVN
jgi:membrane carboxypeptidase/penicillin-binding protein PbpC